jgi:alcohol dehydrogenase class IV
MPSSLSSAGAPAAARAEPRPPILPVSLDLPPPLPDPAAVAGKVVLRQPAEIRFGAGCALDCPGALAARGVRRLLVVSGRRAAEAARPLLAALGAAGIETEVFAAAPAEPGADAFEGIRGRFAGRRFDAVAGIGGGSALDLAKLLAVLADRAEPVRECFGIGRLPPRKTVLVCLPTTAGTGSEVSPNAVLRDERERLKQGLVSPGLVPDAAFVDPELMAAVPPDVTAATAFDALAHCIEAFANRGAHPAVDLYALAGIRLIGAHVERAVRDGRDLAARSALALGSLYGGLCLGPVNTAGVHALAYPLGGEFGVPHGVANAVLLAPVLRFNLSAAPARYAAVARALGCEQDGDDEAIARRGLDRLGELAAACGLPRGLAALGIPADAAPRMAAAAMRVTRLLANNPRTITSGDAERIYREAA